MNTGLIILFVVIGLLIYLRKVIWLFLNTQFAQVDVTFAELLGMMIRKVDLETVVYSYLNLVKSGVNVTLQQIEIAFHQKRNIKNLTDGLLTAKKHNIPLTFDQAKEADEKGIKISDELLKSISK